MFYKYSTTLLVFRLLPLNTVRGLKGPKGQGSGFSEAFHNYKAVGIKAGLITPIFIGQGVVCILFGLAFLKHFHFTL